MGSLTVAEQASQNVLSSVRFSLRYVTEKFNPFVNLASEHGNHDIGCATIFDASNTSTSSTQNIGKLNNDSLNFDLGFDYKAGWNRAINTRYSGSLSGDNSQTHSIDLGLSIQF